MLKRETGREGEGEIEIDLIERLWKGTLDRSNQKKEEERRGQRRQERIWCKVESGIKTQNSCDSVVLGIHFTVFVFLF